MCAQRRRPNKRRLNASDEVFRGNENSPLKDSALSFISFGASWLVLIRDRHSAIFCIHHATKKERQRENNSIGNESMRYILAHFSAWDFYLFFFWFFFFSITFVQGQGFPLGVINTSIICTPERTWIVTNDKNIPAPSYQNHEMLRIIISLSEIKMETEPFW